MSDHQDIHMDSTKTLKPTVANDPHAISSPSSKSSRVACAGRGDMLDCVVEAKFPAVYLIYSRLGPCQCVDRREKSS